MLTLQKPDFPLAPQFDIGSVDLIPSPPETDTLGPNALPTPPLRASGMDVPLIAQTIGIGLAQPYMGTGTWQIAETLVYFNSNTSSISPCELRPPTDFVARMRTKPQSFVSLDDFKKVVRNYRDHVGVPLPCIESKGRRFEELMSTGFDNLTEGVEIWDIFDEYANIASDLPLGCALIARQSDVRTQQHWVLFHQQRFDQVRCVRRQQGYGCVDEFLNQLQDRGDPATFTHAYEEALHYPDLPWS